MQARLLSLAPTDAATKAGRPALTPELLAAVLARISRNNEGLDSILEKVNELIASKGADKAVDAVFKFVDFGHASIADMAPVAMCLDGISIWLAYLVWSLCPTRVDLPIDSGDCGEDEMLGGQESSTRYIRMSTARESGATFGVPLQFEKTWQSHISEMFAAYHQALEFWEKQAEKDPSVMRLPKSLLEDPSEKAVKQVARLKRNYAFDRARYFLPIAAYTNMAMVMPARTWAALCQYLLSTEQVEMQRLGEHIRNELELASPNLVRHAVRKDYTAALIADEFAELQWLAQESSSNLQNPIDPSCPCEPYLDVLLPRGCPLDKEADIRFARDLAHHTNRYAPVGRGLRDTAVRFGWNAVALAEIRDLNRHRTGQKYAPAVPLGFYCALDQNGQTDGQADGQTEGQTDGQVISELLQVGAEACRIGLQRLQSGYQDYVYWLPLGVQFRFQHLTTADKFIYEAELRTGTGAHFRYASHLRSALELWYIRFPRTRSLILEGSAEPE